MQDTRWLEGARGALRRLCPGSLGHPVHALRRAVRRPGGRCASGTRRPVARRAHPQLGFDVPDQRDARDGTARGAAGQPAAGRSSLYPEEIDPLRFRQAVDAEIVALLRRKYEDTQRRPGDRIGHRAAGIRGAAPRHIWPGAPIVFNGVSEGARRLARPAAHHGRHDDLRRGGNGRAGPALVPSARRRVRRLGRSDFDRFSSTSPRGRLARFEAAGSPLPRGRSRRRRPSRGSPRSARRVRPVPHDAARRRRARSVGPGAGTLADRVRSSVPVLVHRSTRISGAGRSADPPRATTCTAASAGGSRAGSSRAPTPTPSPSRPCRRPCARWTGTALQRWRIAEAQRPRGLHDRQPPPGCLARPISGRS